MHLNLLYNQRYHLIEYNLLYIIGGYQYYSCNNTIASIKDITEIEIFDIQNMDMIEYSTNKMNNNTDNTNYNNKYIQLVSLVPR